MKRHNFKKNFGQNFLRNGRFVGHLLGPLKITEQDFVIEIGPGDGMVTSRILEKGAALVAIEIDDELIPKLQEKFSEYTNFQIHHENVLDITIAEIIAQYIPEAFAGRILVTGSLPYNISKKIINNFLQFNVQSSAMLQIDAMCFVVQDEVAKSYASLPPKATHLSMMAGLYATVKKHESIPAAQFQPRPKVDGGIVYFGIKDDVPLYANELEKLLNIGFSSPRKTLLNNLKHSKKYPDVMFEKVLEGMGISPTARASELTLEQWKSLYEACITVSSTRRI